MSCEQDQAEGLRNDAAGRTEVASAELGNKLFTAAQIPRAAGITRQAADARLRLIPSGDGVSGQGNDCAGYRFADLPMDWQLEITRRGVKRGFENGEQFLANLPEPWKCPLPWDQIPEHQRDKAVKLQKALARPLAMRGDGNAVASQMEHTGLEDFKAEFGYSISRRHWHRLLHRTVERDAGEENWRRMDIYLDERAFAAPSAKPEAVRNEFQHRELDETIAALENRQDPTPADREFLWDAVFHHYEQQTDQLAHSAEGNRERRLFRASLVHYLFKAFPERTLCATEASLKRRFKEKLFIWRSKGRTPDALKDKRPLNSGKFRKEAFDEDIAKMLERAALLDWKVDRALEELLAEGKLSNFARDLKAIFDRTVLHDGKLSLAYRLLHEEGKLTREFCEFYPFDPRTGKSEVPHAIRKAITPLMQATVRYRRSEWEARMHGPYIQQEHLEAPGDWFCADDVTWNHYFRVEVPGGGWRVIRGECLLMTDYKTGYPLGHLLIPGHYNGEHIRDLVLKVHDLVGLPRRGFRFERGVWKSHLVVGDKRQGTPVHWREAENGLRSPELKLEISHAGARNPRGKAMLEREIGIVQDRMRCIPNFVGFNEQVEKRERAQELIRRANNGDMEAVRQFPTQAEWSTTISAVLDKFAHDPQNGETLREVSPAEAWNEENRNRPLRRLADESRYILSTHRKEVTVDEEGIFLTIRGHRRLYYNEHTGRLIGERVLTFYNLEMPELLTVSDLDRKNYFSVRSDKLIAIDAPSEQYSEMVRRRKAHMAPAKAMFNSIKHEVISTITRDNQQCDEDKALGRFHNQEMARAKAENTERGRKLRKLQVKAARAGIELTGRVRNLDDALEAIERREHFLRAMREEEAASEAGN